MTDIRTVLRLDALASGGLGVVLLALAKILEDPLGLHVTFSVVVGLGLLNLAWVGASVMFAVGGWGGLTGWGVGFVLVQAAAVSVLIALQVSGRRALPTPVAA